MIMSQEIKIPEIEMVPVNDLKIDGKNPNKMTTEQERALDKNIKKFGFIIPIITNKDLLIADGEHRWRRARALGMKTVPVIRLLIEEIDRRILRQILNKLRGQHDEDLDREEFRYFLDNNSMDAFLELVGEEDKKVVQFLASLGKEGLGDDSLDIDASINKPKYDVKPGDIWELEEHRLMCGDATNSQHVGNLLGNYKIDMVFTDPPYGVNYSDKNKFLNKIDKGNRVQEEIINDNIEDYNAFFGSWLKNIKKIMGEKNSVYITISGEKLFELLEELKKLDFKNSQLLVWAKNNHVLGRQDYFNKHELIVTGDFEGSEKTGEFIVYGWWNKHKFYGRFGTTIWEFDKPVRSKLHPTMKPVDLIKRAVINSSPPNGKVLDLFGGSGSTLIACEQLSRTCYIMEIDSKYCSVILERWETVTSKTAKKAAGVGRDGD